MKRKKIAVLVSGGGTNLQALIDSGIEIEVVISSNPNAYALTRARENNIKSVVISHSQQRFTDSLLETLEYYSIELVVLAGFLRILDERVVKAYPNAMINVHPSLIPAFSGEGFYGLKVHEAALARGVKLSGATVHYVNEICDGGEIILQRSVEVYDDDTPESLQARVMEVEREILPAAVKLLCGITDNTSDVEIQRKIDSIVIDFERDNILPELNKEDLEKLGKESKPVILKKVIIDKNINNHPDIKPKEYKIIIGKSLYRPELIIPGHGEKPYFNFVSRIGKNKNTIVLLELSETKEGYEIVNLHWARDKSRVLIENKGAKQK